MPTEPIKLNRNIGLSEIVVNKSSVGRGIRIRIQPDDVMVRGDVAFVRRTIFLSQGSPGGTTKTELRYLEICERTEDQRWQVVCGMDGPVQEYVAGS